MKKNFAFAVLAAALAFGTSTVTVGAMGEPTSATTSVTKIVDPVLISKLSSMTDLQTQKIILTYETVPSKLQLNELAAFGLTGGKVLGKLPMVITTVTKSQLQTLLESNLTGLKSVYADKELKYLLDQSVAKIGANKVWTDSKLGFTGRGVGVAVLDSGVDATHPDLQKRTVKNVKIVDDIVTTFLSPTYLEGLPDTDNAGGHGTHVAGTIAGDGTGSGGKYKGVAPEANLVGISAGAAILVTSALEGLEYVLQHQQELNLQIVSNSWGTEGAFDANDPINVATKTLHDKGVTVVFAAGNSGPDQNTLNPYSVAPWVISVAAGSKVDNTLADFSSRGIPGDSLYHPTVTAPGVDIIAAKAKQSVLAPLSLQKDLEMIPLQYQPFYTTMSGTSMATPHVSGVIALMEEANPSLTPDQAKQILIDTAVPMLGYQEFEVGAGYADAYAAVTSAAKLAGTGKR